MFFFFMGGVPFSRLLPGLPTVSNSPKAYTAFSFYTPIGTTSVGDHRQATFKTNQSAKNKRFEKQRIVDKFMGWEVAGKVNVDIHNHSYRCVQEICDVADKLFPDVPRTLSRNHTQTDHDGVFLVRREDVASYIERFSPQGLRYNRKTRNIPGIPYNYGEAKGMTFERVLIYPHKALEKYCLTGELKDAGKELPKIYVAISRARQSVGIVVPDGTESGIAPVFPTS